MTNRRRPIDRASDIVAQARHHYLDALADEAAAHEDWKQDSVSATDAPAYLAGLANPTAHSTPIGTTD
jgi:hypothetical protein